ncbi:MAG: DUF2809 domain-containing protein [Cyanobacteriota bacterium]|nr:DUF2809 domain-containing protein [Cyanobacteriota bacterium]
MTIWHNRRFLTLLLMVVMTIVGFAMKFYSGLVRGGFNNSLGGVLYQVFWLFPHKKAIAPICVCVFLATSALEVLQLWKTPVLEGLRSQIVGRLLLGTTFVGSDFFFTRSIV